MKKIPMLLLIIICLPILGIGAQIYGNLRWNGGNVGMNVPVKIVCDQTPYEARTDANGSYTVPLRLSKKCDLSVYFADRWSRAFVVYPYEDPVRYDFDLIDVGNAIELRRR